jgi:hypothetical protein
MRLASPNAATAGIPHSRHAARRGWPIGVSVTSRPAPCVGARERTDGPAAICTVDRRARLAGANLLKSLEAASFSEGETSHRPQIPGARPVVHRHGGRSQIPQWLRRTLLAAAQPPVFGQARRRSRRRRRKLAQRRAEQVGACQLAAGRSASGTQSLVVTDTPAAAVIVSGRRMGAGRAQR